MRRTLCLLAVVIAGAATSVAANEKIFYNVGKTTGSVRDQTSVTDQLYSMQPQMFRTGYGSGAGFRGVIQDQEAATAEAIRLGLVRYASNGIQPDTSAPIAEVTYQIFGTGSGPIAYLYTFTVAMPFALPAHVGIRATLAPALGWPNDGVSIHYQSGTQTKIPASVTKPQWTWSGASALAFLPAGSTLHLGGLYVPGTVRPVVRTSAYGTPEDLVGPESLYPDSGRGDRLGFAASHGGFKSQLVVFLLSPGFGPAIPTPLGSILVQPAGLIVLPALPLDTTGSATLGPLPLPGAVSLAMQALFFDPTQVRLELSDAAAIAGV